MLQMMSVSFCVCCIGLCVQPHFEIVHILTLTYTVIENCRSVTTAAFSFASVDCCVLYDGKNLIILLQFNGV